MVRRQAPQWALWVSLDLSAREAAGTRVGAAVGDVWGGDAVTEVRAQAARLKLRPRPAVRLIIMLAL